MTDEQDAIKAWQEFTKQVEQVRYWTTRSAEAFASISPSHTDVFESYDNVVQSVCRFVIAQGERIVRYFYPLPVPPPFIAAPQYPRYLYEEIHGLSDYDDVCTASEIERIKATREGYLYK